MSGRSECVRVQHTHTQTYILKADCTLFEFGEDFLFSVSVDTGWGMGINHWYFFSFKNTSRTGPTPT